jgi:hypothetical protein
MRKLFTRPTCASDFLGIKKNLQVKQILSIFHMWKVKTTKTNIAFSQNGLKVTRSQPSYHKLMSAGNAAPYFAGNELYLNSGNSASAAVWGHNGVARTFRRVEIPCFFCKDL